ncbi:hypothetical protein JNW98_10555 [Streptomyces sp. SCA2-4]|nr:hypothetical protein [Streptomyces huiliensis]MBZ4319804.1 hypothetical protein [Streptomyces huiliensis]
MHQEAVPAEAVPHQAASPRQDPPKGLLQQMEELMAALDADLSRLDADLQSSAEKPARSSTDEPTQSPVGEPAPTKPAPVKPAPAREDATDG